jgi:hypothetical protein
MVTMPAVLEYLEAILGFYNLLKTFGGVKLLMTGRAAPSVELLIQHPELCIDVSYSPDGGAGIFTIFILSDPNGRRGVQQRIDLRFPNALITDSLQVLSLTFLIDYVNCQGGFTGAGKTGKHDELISWDLQSYILQVTFLGTNNDHIVHSSISLLVFFS